ncbi:VMAP-C domain-containing protein [Streptomyces muensis]|nr:hypothetical protein [Streptomyces muensis]
MEQREVGVLLSRLGRAYQRLAGDESVATGVRPVRADGGSADFRRGPLVDALCGLSCMRDPRSRAAFAEALDEDYGIAATLTGDARIDIARMVRAALRVSQGVHALVETTELFAGAEVAAQIGCLLDPVRQDTDTGPDLRMDAPLGWEEQAAARRLLSMPPLLPVRRLREGLVRELSIPLSPDLDIGQLFSRALTLNNQPDGLPPSVLLLDLAADLTPPGEPADRLRELAARVAGRLELGQALERRRAARARPVTAAEAPRCLLVMVDPARDGTADIEVQYWVNPVPGRWNPRQGRSRTTTPEGLADAVTSAVRAGARLWAEAHDADTGPELPPPYIEFALPYEWLVRDVTALPLETGDGASLPISPRFPVHLRCLERMRGGDPIQLALWRSRWRALHAGGAQVHHWRENDMERLSDWQTELALHGERTVVLLDAPAGGPPLAALRSAVAEGVGVAVWDRRGVFAHESREQLQAVFSAAPTPSHIPQTIRQLRVRAALNKSPDIGEHIVLFWDDPYRLVGAYFDPPEHEELAE